MVSRSGDRVFFRVFFARGALVDFGRMVGLLHSLQLDRNATRQRPRDELECPGPGAGSPHYRETSMKKKVKKMVLAKETLQSLNSELGAALGGSGTVLCTTDPFRYCPREPASRLEC